MRVLHVFALVKTGESFFDGQFKYLADHGQEIHLVGTPSDTIKDFARRNTLTYHRIPVPRTLSPRQDLQTVRELCRLIKRIKLDVVVGHTPKGALLSMIAARLSGVKRRVYLRHGYVYTTAVGLKRKILRAEEQFVSSLATHIINVSPSIGVLAVKDGLNSDRKQTVIGKGTCGGIDTQNKYNPALIDPENLRRIRRELGISENDYVLGFCGRLCKDKGIPELVEAFSLFQERHKDISSKLLLIGGDDARDIMPKSVHEAIQNNPDIIAAGRVPKTIIENYYMLMDVFVFPSHREGFGMSSIEAQAMGKPALVARSHGCVDSIEQHESGEYIPLDAAGICQGMEFFIDEKRREEYGQRARAFVVDNFDCRILWPQIADFYDSLLAQPAAH